MAEITAKMVADLRAATGLGMMECKKALVEAEGVLGHLDQLEIEGNQPGFGIGDDRRLGIAIHLGADHDLLG